tara:strand:+ start:339 stop:821 length:483 start_codon:yes stop_codon:yes gene_type:complete
VVKVGDYTLIGMDPYTIADIVDGIAYLRKISETNKGRHKEMKVELVPYFENGEWIIPEKPQHREPAVKKVNIPTLLRDAVDLPISRPARLLINENLESILVSAIGIAEERAKYEGSKKIYPRHWPFIEMNWEHMDRRATNIDYDSYMESVINGEEVEEEA